MAALLTAASIAWPLLLGSAVWDRSRHSHEPTVWATAVYLAASGVCHQHPERSFHSAGAQWPVCARCAGLYLAAPIGALMAAATRRRHARRPWWLLAAAAPTAITWGLEWFGLVAVGNAVRAAAALPLGAALAAVIVSVASGRPRSIG